MTIEVFFMFFVYCVCVRVCGFLQVREANDGGLSFLWVWCRRGGGGSGGVVTVDFVRVRGFSFGFWGGG